MNMSILYRLRYFVTYLPKYRGHVTMNIPLLEVLYHAYADTRHDHAI